MGGPILGFCGGRVDDSDGADSMMLGPSEIQTKLMPCPINGTCKSPLGVSTVGLIYVNPGGPMGVPSPGNSSLDIRDVFGRMNLNDTETVALIGGGHAFGKCHGACPAGAGKPPKEDPINPWPGLCGKGKGKDTFTSGFEVVWTTNPTQWDNEFFKSLLRFEWELFKGPADKNQWKVKANNTLFAPSVDGKSKESIGMLTTDIALIRDKKYLDLVKRFASDQEALDEAFAYAWYKLTTRDMGPVTRCIGNNVPPAQPWQFPLPPTPATLPNFALVQEDISNIMNKNNEAVGKFIRLAWQSISTFRATDYLGGGNGARIRFSPQKDWPVNKNLDKVLNILQPVKERFGENLSWADLIVLAGNVAIERAGGRQMKFCGGRTDADDGLGSENLAPRIMGRFDESPELLKDYIKVMGLTLKEFAVLNAGGYAIGDSGGCEGLFCIRGNGTLPIDPQLSNRFFTILQSKDWLSHKSRLYKARNSHSFMFSTDLMFKNDPELSEATDEYINNNEKFLDDFAAAWTKLANADRFDGPNRNICNS